MTGKIARIVRDKGFAFIAVHDSEDVFMHRSVLDGSSFANLREGATVDVDIEDSPKGPRASYVKVLD